MVVGLTRLSQTLARRLRGLLGRPAAPAFDLHDRTAIEGLFTRNGLEPLAASPQTVAEREGDLAVGEKVYELREDVRAAIPLALTPAGREAFLTWFVTAGRREVDATAADVLRVLFDRNARPDRGLAGTYLVNPAWQAAHPDALTPGGWDRFKRWVAAEYRVSGRWLRDAALPPRFAAPPALPTGLGVNVIGLFRHTSGLQQNAVAVVDALTAAGVKVALRDVPMGLHRDGRPRAGFDSLEEYPVTLLDTGLDMPAAEAYRLAGLHPRPGVYRVSIWSWELEQLPAGWQHHGDGVDEAWAPTTFIAEALKPFGKPTFTMLTPAQLAPFAPRPKADFGLDPAKFTFLFVFDMNSRLARKNPLGLIRAFRLAFKPTDPVELAIKVSPQEKYYADWWHELRAAAAGGGVKLIDRNLPRGDVLALMNAADCYVSLHRSEGVGLTMAESMLLGKPVIATGYAGNLDFMTSENSYLVKYEKTTIAEDIPPYPKGCVWAEPSVEHAAELMRRVFENPAEARAVAARGQADARRLFDPLAAGRQMAARLAAIARMRGG